MPIPTFNPSSPSSSPHRSRPAARRAPLRARVVLGVAAVVGLLFLTSPLAADPARTEGGAAVAAGDAVPDVRWYREVGPALAEAKRSGRLVLVDLYADWCGWCKHLDKEFNTAHFRRWAQDYVLLRVDVEDGAEGTALQSHLGVRALPTTALIDHEKTRVGLLKGFKPAPQLTQVLDQRVASYEAKRAELDRKAANDDPTVRLAAADELRALHAGSAAAKIYRSVLDGDLNDATRARVGAALADALLMTEDFAGAHASVAAARRASARTDKEARFRTEQLLDNLSLRITQEMEDCEQVEKLETFLSQRPSSSYADQVRDRLADLKSGDAAGCS